MAAKAAGDVLALDVGTKRIGVARANLNVGLAEPLTTLANDASTLSMLQQLCQEHGVTQIVVGLPRGLDGQETSQTKLIRQFAAELTVLGVPMAWQDEALTSRQAEAELNARGRAYAKGDIDALAATLILEDYLKDQNVKLD